MTRTAKISMKHITFILKLQRKSSISKSSTTKSQIMIKFDTINHFKNYYKSLLGDYLLDLYLHEPNTNKFAYITDISLNINIINSETSQYEGML